jgi:uncharacterized membrane protein YjdF/outer membrane lipoprotein-sorting protein
MGFLNRFFPIILLGLFIPFWIIAAFISHDFIVWSAEAVLILPFLVVLYVSHHRLPLKNISYFFIFLFLVLAQIGAIYTFEHVPYNAWSDALFGFRIDDVFGFERTQYDRLVHFAFGSLLYFPIYEAVKGLTGIESKFWRHFFTLSMVITCGAIYEMIELLGMYIISAESYWLYLGMQGDIMDTPKDMVMGTLGALFARGVMLIRGRVKASPVLLLLALILPISLLASSPDEQADAIVRRSVERYNMDNMYSEVHMEVVRPNWKSELRFKAWLKPESHALVLITAPQRDSGQAFLKRDNDLWHWIPSVDKTIKMSSALLSQEWMGSDFSLDDLIRNTSLASDYTASLAGEETIRDIPCFTIILTPKPGMPVVWGKVRAWIAKDTFDQLRIAYYDDGDQLIQVMDAFDFQEVEERRMPFRIEMVPVIHTGRKTTVRVYGYSFDLAIDDDFFSLQNMLRMR